MHGIIFSTDFEKSKFFETIPKIKKFPKISQNYPKMPPNGIFLWGGIAT
jgi:hypothetical protein